MSENGRTRVYLDITETATHGLRTGIQRLVRQTVLHSADASRTLGVEIVPVYAIGGRFHRVRNADAMLRPRPAQPASGPGDAGQSSYRAAAALGRRLLAPFPALGERVRRRLHARRVRRDFADAVEEDAFAFRRGDLVILLDSFGALMALEAAFEAQDRGAGIAVVVHDVIALTHPELFDEQTVELFRRAMGRALARADYVFGVSASTLREIRSLFPACRAATGDAMGYFHHGADLDGGDAPGPSGADTELPPRFFEGEPVFLMVGTLEPRKRHAFVLDAFERRWAAGGAGKLLILGRVGWKVEALLRRIRQSPEFGSRLALVENASDAALAEAMRRSHALIQASEAEGFGLPVVEALRAGLPVLASDIPVFREIGGEFPIYFALDGPEGLASAIERLDERYAEVRARVAEFRWPSWETAVVTLLQAIVSMHAGRIAPTTA